MNDKINFYSNIYKKNCSVYDMSYLIREIIPDKQFLKKLKEIRNEKDEEKRKKLKKQRPCFIPQVFFDDSGDERKEIPTRLIVLDFDNSNDQTKELIEYLVATIGSHCYLISPSPSGTGVHAYVLIEKPEGRKVAYAQLAMNIAPNYGLFDLAYYKNPKQKISITSDEQPFLNEKPEPLVIEEKFKAFPYCDELMRFLRILQRIDSQGVKFVKDQRREYTMKLAGLCAVEELDKQLVLNFMDDLHKFSKYPKHVKTFEGLYEKNIKDSGDKGNGKKKAGSWTPERIMEFIKKNYPIKKNELTQDYYLNSERFNDEHLNTMFTDFFLAGALVSRTVIKYLCENNYVEKFHPVLDFINKHTKLKPKGEIAKLAACLGSSTYGDLTFNFIEEVLTRYLIGIINQVFSDKPNEILFVILGKQNVGKTWFFRYLLPKDLRQYYTEHPIENSKDFLLLMSKNILLLDDELSGKKKIEMDALKTLMSSIERDIRVPYGVLATPRKMIASFAGTGNTEDILKDPTGNRRIIPVWVDHINQDLYNEVDKDALFVEVYNLWKAGHSYQLEKRHRDALANVQGQFEFKSMEEELLLRYYKPAPESVLKWDRVLWMPTSEVVETLGGDSLKLSVYHMGIALKKNQFPYKYKLSGKSKLRQFALLEIDEDTDNYQPSLDL